MALAIRCHVISLFFYATLIIHHVVVQTELLAEEGVGWGVCGGKRTSSVPLGVPLGGLHGAKTALLFSILQHKPPCEHSESSREGETGTERGIGLFQCDWVPCLRREMK